MSGKYPGDRAHLRQDVPETYEQHRERFTEAEAAMRQADDPISGQPPPTDRVPPVADELTSEEREDGRA